MIPSQKALSPVVTILSPSPAASRRAQEILGNLFGLDDHGAAAAAHGGNDHDDALNAKFKSFLGPTMTWDSVSSRCPASGTLLHWLSLDNNSNQSSSDTGGKFSLLAVTATAPNDTCSNNIQQARAVLASNLPNSLIPLKLRHLANRPLTADAMLRRHQGLPILDLQEAAATTATKEKNDPTRNGRLKEVAFTMYDDAVYEDGSTVLSQLSQSDLLRPVTGLYQWPPSQNDYDVDDPMGFCLRPLPSAKPDLRGSSSQLPLVLTFHCESVEEVLQKMQQQQDAENSSGNVHLNFSKIGYTGHRRGQLRVQASSTGSGNESNNSPAVNCLPGLDIRWCDSTTYSSMFNEAQEALLASSLPELQSSNVLKAEPGVEDARIGSSDCWVEVRTMAKNPIGFVPQRRGFSTKVRRKNPNQGMVFSSFTRRIGLTTLLYCIIFAAAVIQLDSPGCCATALENSPNNNSKMRTGFGGSKKNKHGSSPFEADNNNDDTDGAYTYHWEEDASYFDKDIAAELQKLSDFSNNKPKRKYLWLGNMEDESYDPSSSSESRSKSASDNSPQHMLRMDTWDMSFAWRERRRKRNPKAAAMTFVFHENGYVRCLHPDAHRKIFDVNDSKQASRRKRRNRRARDDEDTNSHDYVVGTWKMAPSGVVWEMKFDERTTYNFYADLHLNPFGKHPKMFRGLVIRDRSLPFLPKRLLRPVVATFTGKGTGKDTADFSYKGRRGNTA